MSTAAVGATGEVLLPDDSEAKQAVRRIAEWMVDGFLRPVTSAVTRIRRACVTGIGVIIVARFEGATESLVTDFALL